MSEAELSQLPQAVLFDWDNALVENWRAIQSAMKRFGDDWQRSRKVFLDHFEQNHLAALSIMIGAETLMDALAERGIPLAIVSNKIGNLLRREVAYLGWSERFSTSSAPRMRRSTSLTRRLFSWRWAARESRRDLVFGWWVIRISICGQGLMRAARAYWWGPVPTIQASTKGLNRRYVFAIAQRWRGLFGASVTLYHRD